MPRCYTGAGGVVRPQSLSDCQRTDPFDTASTAVATSPHRRPYRPTREVVTGLVPGSYRSTGSHSASSWGHQGVGLEWTKRPGSCERYQPPAQHRGGSFRPHCRVSMPLLAERVPSARHRTGGRHCLYRLESAPAPAYTGYRERSPEALQLRAGSSSSYPRIILSDPSCARADCLFSLFP